LIAATTKIVSRLWQKKGFGIVIYALTSKRQKREREDELLHEPLDAHNKLANWVKRPVAQCLLFLSFIAAASNSRARRVRQESHCADEAPILCSSEETRIEREKKHLSFYLLLGLFSYSRGCVALIYFIYPQRGEREKEVGIKD